MAKKIKHSNKIQNFSGKNFNRTHKDRLFRFIFNDKLNLLSLYNAINHSNYTNEDDLIIYTMEDFIYMGMKNDLSFLIDDHLSVYEHQSTYNPNMPIRGFLYMASAFKKYISRQHLDFYSSKPIFLPIPEYYVFYNGTRNMPDQQILRLTDSMQPNAQQKSCVQFNATMININANHSPELMRKCPKLYEYAIFISKIRDNISSNMHLEEAIETAVMDCIQNNILADILQDHKMEVTDMLLDEYDEEFHIKCEKKISYEDGFEEGRHFSEKALIQEKKRAEKNIKQKELQNDILKLIIKGYTPVEISDKLSISEDFIHNYLKQNNIDR